MPYKAIDVGTGEGTGTGEINAFWEEVQMPYQAIDVETGEGFEKEMISEPRSVRTGVGHTKKGSC